MENNKFDKFQKINPRDKRMRNLVPRRKPSRLEGAAHSFHMKTRNKKKK